MSTKNELISVYESWREWTEVEHGAIAASDWGLLETCHQAKLQLQQIIVRLSGAADAEDRQLGHVPRELDSDLRALVQDLIVLETRNSNSLAAKRQETLREKADLDRTSSNLRKVHRSYAGQRAGGVWQRYS